MTGRARSVAFACFAQLALAACAGGERPVPTTPASAPANEASAVAAKAGVRLDPTGRWKSIDAQGASATVEFRAGTISADAGCNPLGADYSIDTDGSITIGRIRSGKRYCEGRMAAETRIAKALAAARSIRRDRARLELLDASGNVVLTLDAE